MPELIDIHSQVEKNWGLHQVELKYATFYVKLPNWVSQGGQRYLPSRTRCASIHLY